MRWRWTAPIGYTGNWSSQEVQAPWFDEAMDYCINIQPDGGDIAALRHAEDVGWEMDEGSICGLGMVAAKPLESAREHFPEAFRDRSR